MSKTNHQKPLLDYLTGVRGFPVELARHLGAQGFRLLTDATTVDHVLTNIYGLRNLDQVPAQGLVIPYHDVTGAALIDSRFKGKYERMRCEPAAKLRNGDTCKYLAPRGSSNHLSLPRGKAGAGVIELASEAGCLIFTEGELKAWVATWHGFPTVGLSGVWNWVGSPGGKQRVEKADGSHEWEKPKGVPIADLEFLPWEELRLAGVRVLIVFDSDASDKTDRGGVSHARASFAKHLREDRGMDVWLADLPAEPGGGKNGLDDYLLRYGVDALTTVLADARPSKGKRPRTPEDEAAIALGIVEAMTAEDLDAHTQSLRNRLRRLHSSDKEYKEVAGELQEAEREQSHREAEAKYGLNLRGTPYTIDAGGVRRQVQGRAGDPVVSTRPIWPALVGRDVASGETYVEVAWVDTTAAVVREWLPHRFLSDARELCLLDGANVTRGRINRVSDWLGDATGYLVGDRKAAKVASRMGWIGSGDARRFILPGSTGVVFIGQGWEVRGTLAGWAEGVRRLLNLGPDGYVGLAVVGLCAGAPLVRFQGHHRNPSLGMVGPSGTGKNTLIEFGLSLWGSPGALSVSVGSTQKGIQDANVNRAGDLPFFVDEVQRLYNQDHDGPRQVADLLYFLGNGQRRTTSSRNQQAVGGERRWGTNLYASEDPIIEFMPTGAGNRAIELCGLIKHEGGRRFVPDKPFADGLKAIADANLGAGAAALADLITRGQTKLAEEVAAIASQIGDHFPGLQGDDHFTIAVVVVGIALVGELAGLELPALEVGKWLAEFTTRERSCIKDQARQAFEAVCGLALGADFRELMPQDFGPPLREPVNHAIVNGEYIAWRSGLGLEWIEVNPHHPLVEARLRAYGGGKKLAQVWTQRGWLMRQEEDRTGWKRAGFGRVWRVPGTALDGVGPVLVADDENGNFPVLGDSTGNGKDGSYG